MGLWQAIFGASAPAAGASGGRVDGAKARELVARGARLVDVRTPGEFREHHLDGAVNVPLDVLTKRLDDVGRRDQPVVLYCRSGARSATAARQLRTAGFEQVYDLGSWRAW